MVSRTLSLEVFQRIGYDESLIGVEQIVEVGGIIYNVKIQSRYYGENGRANYKILLSNVLPNRNLKWHHRAWNELFHLVEDPNGIFITLYTEKKDPSKILVYKFFNLRFVDINDVRSIPTSSLLFKSIISYAAHESLESIRRYCSFPLIKKDQTSEASPFSLQGASFSPFLSIGRDLWISFSFTEEKAHRLAIQLSGQAEKIIIVYCHPTFTKHHRADNPSVHVVSLSEYLRMLSPELHHRFLQQSRFLINHLRLTENILAKDRALTSDSLLEQIKNQRDSLRIETSELREAKSGLGIITKTKADVAYVCACGNLLNAALNRRFVLYDGSVCLSKNVYSFKRILGRAIEEIILNCPEDVSIYISDEDLAYINVQDLQFSFHAIPKGNIIREFQMSDRNIHQEWSGIRLQPIAPLVLNWARSLLIEESQKPLNC